MNVRRVGLVVGFFLAAQAVSQERPPAVREDTRKDLAALQGTWQLEKLETAKESKVDVKKRTLFIGGDLFLARDGESVLQVGNLRVVSGKSPRRIDVVVRKGMHEDNTMLGIYELKDDTLKMCFDPDGENRPTAFATKADTARFVATYKRVQALGETIDICGKYICTSYGAEGKKKSLPVEIEKRGDAYFLKWTTDGKVVYIGAGIRQGNSLSVAYFNPGNAGLSVYKIEKGPRLIGVFTDVGGPGLIAREEMHLDREVRFEANKGR